MPSFVLNETWRIFMGWRGHLFYFFFRLSMLYLMGSAQTKSIARCCVPRLWLTLTGSPYYIQRA
jgi:hypothetical protein